MSNRERWTIYPLLFMTLLIVLKDKLTKMITADRVTCKMLVVTDRDQHERVVLTSTDAGGLVMAKGSNLGINVLLGHTNKVVGLMFSDHNNNLLPPSFKIRPPQPRPPGPNQLEPAGAAPPDRDESPPAGNPEPGPPASEEQAK